MPISKKMLTVVEMTIEELKIGMLDLNYAPHLAKEYGIEKCTLFTFF